MLSPCMTINPSYCGAGKGIIGAIKFIMIDAVLSASTFYFSGKLNSL